MRIKNQGYKGSNLVEYVIPLAVIGVAVGIAMFSMYSNDSLKYFFASSTNAEVDNDTIIINKNIGNPAGNGIEILNLPEVTLPQETTGGVASVDPSNPVTTTSIPATTGQPPVTLASADTSLPSGTEPVETTAALASMPKDGSSVVLKSASISSDFPTSMLKSASTKSTGKSGATPGSTVVKKSVAMAAASIPSAKAGGSAPVLKSAAKVASAAPASYTPTIASAVRAARITPAPAK
jgi:hypothetical protein